jgi:hypothetical protein
MGYFPFEGLPKGYIPVYLPSIALEGSMQLHPANLIVEETGATNTAVLKAMARRRAMADYGALSPRALRQALRYYGGMLGELQAAWRQQHGLPVKTTSITPHGKQRDSVRRSTF